MSHARLLPTQAAGLVKPLGRSPQDQVYRKITLRVMPIVLIAWLSTRASIT
jgi:hypothetical protein